MADPRYSQNRNKFHRPEIFLADVLRRSARGELLSKDEPPVVLYRVLVVAVDVVGGRLENPSGAGSVTHTIEGRQVSFKASIGPENPKNSIKARIITDGYDRFFSEEDLRVFWPLFPEHDVVPIKPREHAYVLFEDTEFTHGLWVCKVAGQENTNFFRGRDSFKTEGGNLSSKFPDSKAASGPTDDDLSDDASTEAPASDRNASRAFGY